MDLFVVSRGGFEFDKEDEEYLYSNLEGYLVEKVNICGLGDKCVVRVEYYEEGNEEDMVDDICDMLGFTLDNYFLFKQEDILDF